MKVHILGEVHPEIGLLFIIEQSRNLEALRETLQFIDEKKTEKLLGKKTELIKKIILEFERQTKENIKTMQKTGADFYLVEGVEKIRIDELLAISTKAEKERDASLEEETKRLRWAYETYIGLYGRKYETFEYKLPRKAVSTIELPEKSLRLLGALAGKEGIERKIAKKIRTATAPLKHKIRELPASANILKKLKSHQDEKVMIIVGVKHAPVYEKILKISGHETVNATTTKKGWPKRLIEAMERTDSLFEKRSLEAELKKAGVPGKEAGRLAKNFGYTKRMMRLNREE